MLNIPRTITLKRYKTSDHGTQGVLCVPGLGTLHTLELPWRDNKQGESCIPTGQYLCELRKSPRFGLTYHVTNVPDRSFILIHSGNVAGEVSLNLKSDVAGCILLGMRCGELWGQRAVLSSKRAVRLFMEHMQGEEFILNIIGEPHA